MSVKVNEIDGRVVTYRNGAAFDSLRGELHIYALKADAPNDGVTPRGYRTIAVYADGMWRNAKVNDEEE